MSFAVTITGIAALPLSSLAKYFVTNASYDAPTLKIKVLCIVSNIRQKKRLLLLY